MQSVNLVVAFEHPMGTPVPYNSSIMCVAERVSHMPGIKRGKDYHFHARKLLEAGALDVSFPQESSTAKIGGVDFDVMHIEISMGGLTIRQKQYAAIKKGYALSLIVSSVTDEQKESLQKILDSVTFKGK